MEAAQVNLQLVVVTQELKKLQQDTVDDSATVKTITLVSAFYLPGSFIAVSIDNNLICLVPKANPYPQRQSSA